MFGCFRWVRCFLRGSLRTAVWLLRLALVLGESCWGFERGGVSLLVDACGGHLEITATLLCPLILFGRGGEILVAEVNSIGLYMSVVLQAIGCHQQQYTAEATLRHSFARPSIVSADAGGQRIRNTWQGTFTNI